MQCLYRESYENLLRNAWKVWVESHWMTVNHCTVSRNNEIFPLWQKLDQHAFLSNPKMNFPCSYVSAYISGFPFGNIFDALQCLPPFHTKVMKTDFTTYHNAEKVVVDFVSIRLQRRWGNVCLFVFTEFHVCPSRSEELVGTKFPLRRNSSISWAARCPNSFPIDISWLSTDWKVNRFFSWSFSYRQFSAGHYGDDRRFSFSCL